MKAHAVEAKGPHYLISTEESEHQKTSAVDLADEKPMHMGMDVQLDLGFGDTH